MNEPSEYETVAAGQTAQVIGKVGSPNDYIKRIILVPATTTPGVVTLIDGPISISLFAGGTVDVKAWSIEVGMRAKFGPWKLTTGASISAIVVGDFA